VLTPTEVLRRARANVEHIGALTMVGEVSGFRVHNRGHWIFDLRDKENGVPCIMWFNDTRRVKFRLEDGIELKVTGEITVNPYAQIQVRVTAMEPVGQGALELAFRQLKEKLAGEGLFDVDKKKPLPLLPRTVGVVTSPQGAALHDVLKVLFARMPRLRVIVSPTKVQGDGASPEIADAIRRLDKTGVCDVILLVRGGGAREDLQAFNEEPVARAIFHAQTPIVSGVGHESDVTIADLVADKRAATPSNAAELAVPELLELERRLDQAARRLKNAASRDLQRTHRRVDQLAHRLHQAARKAHRDESAAAERLRRRLEDAWQRRRSAARTRVDQLERRLHANAPHRVLAQRRARLSQIDARLQAAWRALVEQKQRALAKLAPRLDPALHRLVEKKKRALALAAARLDALSPLSVVARGYAVVTRSDDGALVQRLADAPPGTSLDVQVSDGSLRARVEPDATAPAAPRSRRAGPR
jgi:exodeoxyribonuclease VII large subunit